MESGDKFQASQRQGLRRQLPQHRSRGRRRKADDRAEGTSGDMVEVQTSESTPRQSGVSADLNLLIWAGTVVSMA